MSFVHPMIPFDFDDTSNSFDHLITSNLAPSAAEIDALHAQINAAEPILAQINRSIESLLAQQQKLAAWIAGRKAVVYSPIRRVPPDVLGEIFRHIDPQDELSASGYDAATLKRRKEEFSSCYLRSGPWFTAHVCRLWRMVLRSQAAPLWTTITMIFSHSCDAVNVIRPVSAEHMLHECLQRSKSFPLDVRVSVDEETTQVVACEAMAFVRLMRESYRWQKANLFLCTSLFNAMIGVKDRLQGLKTLQLHVYNLPDVYDQSGMFTQAPQLHTLDIFPLHSSVAQAFPISQLTTLEVHIPRGYSDYGLLSCLATTSGLQSLSVHSGYMPSRAHDEPMKRISLPALHTLLTNHAIVFHALRLPALHRLRISVGRSDIAIFNMVPILPLFLDASGCNVEELEFLQVETKDARGILSLIALLPTIRSLEVESKTHSDEIFRILGPITARLGDAENLPGGTFFLPQLESFIYKGHHDDDSELHNADYEDMYYRSDACEYLIDILRLRCISTTPGLERLRRLEWQLDLGLDVNPYNTSPRGLVDSMLKLVDRAIQQGVVLSIQNKNFSLLDDINMSDISE